MNLGFLLELRNRPSLAGRWALGTAAVLMTVFVWWYVTSAPIPEERIVSPTTLPSPFEVLSSAPQLVTERGLFQSIAASLQRVLLGFALAILVGVPLGVLAGSWRAFEAFLAPFSLFGRSIPIAALVPLTLIWFGINESQKVMFIFIACVPFVFGDAVRSVLDVPSQYVETARTLGASRWQTVYKVLLPLSLASIYDGLRILFGLAFGYIMLAEVVNADSGLGQLIMLSQRRGPVAHVYLILITIGLIAYGIDRLLWFFQKGLFPYRVKEKLMTGEISQEAAPQAPAERSEHVVEFRNVTKTYHAGTPGAFTAIQDVNFKVYDEPDHGEFVAVLGPSGCGKSTILRLLAGLRPQHPVTTGEVLVDGKPVAGPGADRGMVFQTYTSFDNRSVLSNIVFGLECQGVPRAEREELGRQWIAKVGLDVDDDADKYPHQLSGGMRQRVAIARSLILSPRIILMDEPFGALDPTTRFRMQDLLVGLWREQEATVFFVTHSIEEAVYLGQKILILSTSPGTILKEVDVPHPDRPAREMQKESSFVETVFDIRETIEELEAHNEMRQD